MLACRNCQVNIAASAGCVICNPIRKHLVVIGEDEDERPSLATASNEIVSALRKQLRIIKQSLTGDTMIESEKRLVSIANTMSKVLESARKLQEDGLGVIENMSFPEKAELFIAWITELPPAYRQSLRDKWESWETETSKPLSDLTMKVLEGVRRED